MSVSRACTVAKVAANVLEVADAGTATFGGRTLDRAWLRDMLNDVAREPVEQLAQLVAWVFVNEYGERETAAEEVASYVEDVLAAIARRLSS